MLITERGSRDRPHVLIVGELAYNPERIDLLAERCRALSGLWIDDPLPFMTVGHPAVRDLPQTSRTEWVRAIRSDPPDVAYCLLNWRTIPLALEVADAVPELPLVWHFKEAPQRSLARGDWPLLERLWFRADRVVLASAEERDWMLWRLPGRDPATVHALDGDLAPARWFSGPVAGAVRPPRPLHTVCVGRPIGLTADLLRDLGAGGVHVHLYGVPDAGEAAELARVGETVHVHPRIAAGDWRFVLSEYDAGWSHVTGQRNGGDLARAGWDDLNLPARLPTLAAAGLPVLLPDRRGEINAVDRVVGPAGLRFGDPTEIPPLLRDRDAVLRARQAMQQQRMSFTFESVLDELMAVLAAASRVTA